MRFGKYILLLLFVSLLYVSGCNSEDKATINLAEVTRSVFYAPQYIALAEGFFEDEGLNVELQTTWGGDKTMTALLSDSADIALVGSETSIYVYAQDSRDYAVNFAQLTQTDGTFLVSKEPQPEFTWDDVKGKSFLGQRKGGMPQMVGEFVLKKHNINPQEDLDLIQNIDFANIPGAFVSGDSDYVQLFEPTASIMELEGKGHVIASFGEESGSVPYTVFMAKQSFLDNKEAEVLKFTRAIYNAQQWVENHSPEEIATALQPYFDDTDIDMLATSVERYKSQGSFASTPIFNEEGWNNLKNIMEEAGELPDGDIPYDKLVNNKYAEEVVGN